MKTTQELKDIVARFPIPQSALASILSVLHRNPPEGGRDAIAKTAAELCNVAPNMAADIYNSAPAYQETGIKVCHGLTCSIAGAEEIAERLNKLGAKPAASTCLGYCHAAPVIQDVDGTVQQACLEEDWVALQRGTFAV